MPNSDPESQIGRGCEMNLHDFSVNGSISVVPKLLGKNKVDNNSIIFAIIIEEISSITYFPYTPTPEILVTILLFRSSSEMIRVPNTRKS